MKKFSLAILTTLLGVLLMGAAAVSTSNVLVETTSRALTGNIVVGTGKTISASGGTITANALDTGSLTSAQLASSLTNETGSGKVVFNTDPTFEGDLTLGTSGPSLKSTLNARSPRQGLLFDGSAKATTSVPAFGPNDFTVGAWINVASIPNLLIPISGTTNSFDFLITTDGTIQVAKDNVGNVASASTGTITVGKNAFVAYVRSGTTGTYYINGVAAGTTVDSFDYSTGLTSVGGYHGGGYRITGYLAPVVFNRALSASEITALFESGQVSGADINSASNTAINTSAWTLYAGFAGGFTSTNGTNISASASGGLNYGVAQPQYTVSAGHKYRFACSATITSGTPQIVILKNDGSGIISNVVDLVAGANSFELTATESNSNAFFAVRDLSGGSCNFALTSISITPLGALLAPDASQPGSGTSWYDTSGNNATISWTTGVQWAVPSSGRYAGNNYTFGSRSGEQATPTKVAIDGTFANSSTPTNQQLKLSLIDVSSTEAYGWSVAANGGIWHHSGNTSGETGYHVLATGGVERVRVTSTGSTFSGTIESTTLGNQLKLTRTSVGSKYLAVGGSQELLFLANNGSTSLMSLSEAGNLSVSGTGTHSFAGPVVSASALSSFATRLFINATAQNQFIGDGTGFGLSTASFGLRNDQGNIILAAGGSIPQFTLSSTTLALGGNLTVSGTGTHSFAGEVHGSHGFVATGALSAFTASSGAADFYSGGMRLYSVGADTSTNGTLKLASVRSNGGNEKVWIEGGTDGSVAINGTSAIKGVRTATATVNFGTITAGSANSVTITVSGVAAGDQVIGVDRTNGTYFPGDNLTLDKYVDTDTVGLRLWNPTGSSIVVGSITIRVTVMSF